MLVLYVWSIIKKVLIFLVVDLNKVVVSNLWVKVVIVFLIWSKLDVLVKYLRLFLVIFVWIKLV